MFNRNSNVTSNQSINSSTMDKSDMGSVYHIVLDINDTILNTLEIPNDLKPLFIGAIQFRSNKNLEKADEYLPLAIPYNQNYTSLPIRNEIVRIINAKGGGFYYERIIKSQIPNVSNTDETISSTYKKDSNSKNTSNQYSKVESTGIPRSSNNESTDYDGYGDYFKLNDKLHYLRLYEGDSLIESRFGQSIRFSGYNNSENKFSPTVTIRNGENPNTLSEGSGISVEENVNKDGNIIFLGSGDRLLEYTLPTKNKHQSFENYPNELKGNQILLNSDRVIISAKAGEMIIVSKKDVGFITDGQFSVDATMGINITTDDDSIINTKDRNLSIDIGSGMISLGTDGEVEKAPKGDTLVSLLEELIDLINKQIFLTPAGPSATGPTNIAQFSVLKQRLKTMLSNNVELK